MSKEAIISKLADIIKEELRLGEGVDINSNTTYEEIGVDSIALMQLLVFVEENFGFEFGENVLVQGGIHSIGNMADYILNETSK